MASAEQKGTENAVEAESPNNLESTSEARTGEPRSNTDKEVVENGSASPGESPPSVAHITGQVDGSKSAKGQATDEKAENNTVTHTEAKEEEEEDVNVVYPQGIPLALLTFGLCEQPFTTNKLYLWWKSGVKSHLGSFEMLRQFQDDSALPPRLV